MGTCIRCGARASHIGLRGTVLWTRAHLGDASRPQLERTAKAGAELCPKCRAEAREEARAAGEPHTWKWWRRARGGHAQR